MSGATGCTGTSTGGTGLASQGHAFITGRENSTTSASVFRPFDAVFQVEFVPTSGHIFGLQPPVVLALSLAQEYSLHVLDIVCNEYQRVIQNRANSYTLRCS